MREIAIRCFINDKFNTTFGKGLFRRAMFNGSVELKNPNQKFLIDLYNYANWEAQAKSDQQIETVTKIRENDIHQVDGVLLSWLLHYDPLTKTKTKVDGYAIYIPHAKTLFIDINAPVHQTQEDWTLDVHTCKATGSNKPVFIATNVDLNAWA